MSTKNLIRTIVIVGILSWPAVETYRLWVTTQKLHEAQALERSVTASLAAAREKQAQIAHADSSAANKP
jgi:hypothetical protein